MSSVNATRMRSEGTFTKRNSRQVLFDGDQAQPIRCDVTDRRPESPLLGGGESQKPDRPHRGLERVSLTEGRQSAAPHRATVPWRPNDDYPIPANRRTDRKKALVCGGEALLCIQPAPIQQWGGRPTQSRTSGKCRERQSSGQTVAHRRIFCHARGARGPLARPCRYRQGMGCRNRHAVSLRAALDEAAAIEEFHGYPGRATDGWRCATAQRPMTPRGPPRSPGAFRRRC